MVGRVITRNEVYYKKYPQDVKRVSMQTRSSYWRTGHLRDRQVRDIITYLDGNEVLSSNGGRLSPARFQQLGMDFGMHSQLSLSIIIYEILLKMAL